MSSIIDSADTGRIPELPFKVIAGLFFALALIAAAARAVIRIRQKHRSFGWDDALILISCLLMTAATGLLYHTFDDMYFDEKVLINPILIFRLPPTWVFPLISFQKVIYAYTVLTWCVLFFVKFAYLSLFKLLIRRVVKLEKYWWFVTVICALSCAYCVTEAWITCPHFGMAAIQNCHGGWLSTAPSYAAIGLDILTDLLVISIPVLLLWGVKIKARQRLGLGASLCLSIVMVTLSIIRISGMKLPGRAVTDALWSVFWVQVDTCVAIMMVSLTAFRSLFVTDGSKGSGVKKPSYTSFERLFHRKNKSSSTESPEMEQALPAIPSATMTGMRTFIRGGNGTKVTAMSSQGYDELDDRFGPATHAPPHGYRTHQPVIDWSCQRGTVQRGTVNSHVLVLSKSRDGFRVAGAPTRSPPPHHGPFNTSA